MTTGSHYIEVPYPLGHWPSGSSLLLALLNIYTDVTLSSSNLISPSMYSRCCLLLDLFPSGFPVRQIFPIRCSLNT